MGTGSQTFSSGTEEICIPRMGGKCGWKLLHGDQVLRKEKGSPGGQGQVGRSVFVLAGCWSTVPLGFELRYILAFPVGSQD